MPRLPVFRCEYRRVGTLDAVPVFRVAESAEHAEKLIRADLSKRITGDFELSEIVECTDAELPNSERLFSELRRQRAELSPRSARKSTGNFFAFFVRTGDNKPRRLWVYDTAGELSARVKVESRLNVKKLAGEIKADLAEIEPPEATELTGRVDRHELSEVTQITGARQSTIFSVLCPDDTIEFVADLEAEHRESVLAYLDSEKQRIERAESVPNLRTPPKVPTLLVDGRAIVKGFDQPVDVGETVKHGLATAGA